MHELQKQKGFSLFGVLILIVIIIVIVGFLCPHFLPTPIQMKIINFKAYVASKIN